MPVSDGGTVNFTDQDSGDEACAIVRRVNACIGLTLSLKRGGDVEVILLPADATRLSEVLKAALRP